MRNDSPHSDPIRCHPKQQQEEVFWKLASDSKIDTDLQRVKDSQGVPAEAPSGKSCTAGLGIKLK